MPSGICPANCADDDLIGKPADDCITLIREDTLSRIAVFPCSVTLPDPITDEAIAALFEDGTIKVSSPLANIVFADVTTEDILIDDCSKPRQIVTGRELTFEDRVAISFTSGSPATTDNYYDYEIWQNWIDRQDRLNVMLIFCSGNVVIPKDRNGYGLRVSLSGSINYQKYANQGGSVEFKRLLMRFSNDPMAFYTAKPAFNYVDAGIVL